MSAARKLDPWQIAYAGSRDDPHRFATGVLGILPHGAPNPGNEPQLDEWNDAFLRGFFVGADGKPTSEPRHSVCSGHGCGKGMTLAVLALWFVTTHYDSKCVLTANSQDQLRDNNWPELRKWASRLPEPLRQQVQIDEERMYVKAAPEMAFVVRRTASQQNPEALQGIHARHVLYLVDEASGVADIVFEVAQGSLSTSGAMAVLMSNGTRASGFFHDTHHKHRDRWRTWRVNAETVPRARGVVEEIAATYGVDSNKYRVRVLGLFPTRDDDAVIPLELIEAARGRDVKPLSYRPIWGVDVARFGDDRSTLVKRAANVLLEPPRAWRNLDSTQVAGRIVAEIEATPRDMWPSEILVDVIGYGSGVVDQLMHVCRLPDAYGIQVRGVNVAESASSSDEYMRLRDELWFRGRQWFAQQDCTIPVAGCETLIGELARVSYDFGVNGKKVVQSKKEMKKDGLLSCDEADGFLLTFAGVPQPRKKAEWWRAGDNRTGWTG